LGIKRKSSILGCAMKETTSREKLELRPVDCHFRVAGRWYSKKAARGRKKL